jgi:DNA-binding transcriptional LysR family regulator
MDLEPPDGYGLVRSRDLDLLITHRYPGAPLPDPRGLRRQLLMTDPLRLVLPAGHPVAKSPRLTLPDLADEEWISGGPAAPNRVCLDQLTAVTGVTARVAYETRDYQVALALIEAGLGIALVPASVLAHGDRTGFAIQDLHGPAPARDIYVVHRTRQGPLVSEMITRLQPHQPD